MFANAHEKVGLTFTVCGWFLPFLTKEINVVLIIYKRKSNFVARWLLCLKWKYSRLKMMWSDYDLKMWWETSIGESFRWQSRAPARWWEWWSVHYHQTHTCRLSLLNLQWNAPAPVVRSVLWEAPIPYMQFKSQRMSAWFAPTRSINAL